MSRNFVPASCGTRGKSARAGADVRGEGNKGGVPAAPAFARYLLMEADKIQKNLDRARDLVENLPKIWFQYQWTSSMKNRLERTQCFLVIIISFFLAVYPVYFQYSDLVEFDFFSPGPILENLDQEDLPGDEHNQVRIFVFIFSLLFSPFGSLRPERLSLFSFPSFVLDRPIFALRC